MLAGDVQVWACAGDGGSEGGKEGEQEFVSCLGLKVERRKWREVCRVDGGLPRSCESAFLTLP